MKNLQVKSKVETLKEEENGVLLKVTSKVYLGGLLVNETQNTTFIAKFIDGITNIIPGKVDDAFVDPVAKLGINTIPNKVWHDSEDNGSEE